ncbi:hypothetical protein MT356_02535 [Rathayibacter festucae]|uniref:hypothetical protein n=1 Tax=Rathayibacter festucae TaxID=110937 RepID=UPI001FB44656|nr:hypothetical protein [Rathayibacter festucae]MCJ1698582.1 hypothetical protein [Rathayibacter festucae]
MLIDTPLRGYSTTMARRRRVLSLTTETRSGFAARYALRVARPEGGPHNIS